MLSNDGLRLWSGFLGEMNVTVLVSAKYITMESNDPIGKIIIFGQAIITAYLIVVGRHKLN